MTKEEAIKVAYEIPVTKEQHEALQFLIPELKEDKDEKIRKALIQEFKEKVQKSFEWKDGIPNNAVLDWLEKQKDAFENGRQFGIMQEQARQEIEGPEHICDSTQYEEGFKTGLEIGLRNRGEQKPADYDHEMWKNCEANFDGGKKEVIEHPERYGLQKSSEWSKEDEKLLNFWLDVIDRNDWRMDENFCKASREFINRLKSMHPQPKQEWSDEDEKELDCIINILDRLGFEEFCKSSRDQDVEEERFYYKEIQFLKRLKSLRPKKLDASKLDNFDPVDVLNRIKTEWPMAWEKVVGRQEWSKEDDLKLGALITDIETRSDLTESIKIKYVSFLKSLRNSWKPSEQEKGALRTAIHILTEERNFPKAAEQLQNILNAFDGEEPRKVWKPTERQLNKLYNIAYGIPDDDDAKVLMEILEGISKL